MNETQMQQYFETHAVDGALPDEEMVKLLTGTADEAIGDNTGDTDGDTPTPAETETTQEAESAPEAAMAEPEEQPVIVAKDGKNTIPYSELADAREAAQNERTRREELERRIAELEARIQGDAATTDDADAADEGPPPDEDPLATLREDWPEVAAAVDKITAAQRQTIAVQQQQIQALTQQLAPIQQSEAERMRARHYTTILDAHPDADKLFESETFVQWMETQPSFVRDVQEAVLQRGTASQIIELFDDFKRDTGWQDNNAAAGDNAATQAQARQAAVQQARQQAKTSTPKSLSDIPGGAAVQTDPTETFLQMSETAQMDKIMGMSPDAIEAMLRRAT